MSARSKGGSTSTRGGKAAGRAGTRKSSGSAGGSGAAQSEQRRRLKSRLSEAIEQVDDEGLLFLLRQANVLIHNQKVDEVNQELAELSARPGQPKARGSIAERPAAEVSVEESGNRSAFFLTLGNVRKVLNLEELRQLVRICYGAESKTDALQQLYTVLARERSDILHDADIRSSANPLMESLFHALRSKYHLEDR